MTRRVLFCALLFVLTESVSGRFFRRNVSRRLTTAPTFVIGGQQDLPPIADLEANEDESSLDVPKRQVSESIESADEPISDTDLPIPNDYSDEPALGETKRRAPFLPRSSRGKLHLSNFKDRFDAIRSKVFVPKLVSATESSPRILSSLGPATLALMFRKPGGVSLATMYTLTLLGSSCGFYLFLYFISVGYALGIALPLSVSLIVYSKSVSLPRMTVVHTLLTILWGIRAVSFFLWREYVNWPALHVKVAEMNHLALPSSKILCWLVYSFFYVSMMLPCWCRLEHPNKSWGPWGVFGTLLQMLGLALETIADYQKSTFKAMGSNRNQWCHVGLWKYSTHPNYVGEFLFWLGTYMGGMAALTTPRDWILATLGLVFISVVMRGAVLSLGSKQLRKYGDNPLFVEFRKTHTCWGPRQWLHLPPSNHDGKMTI